jgi:hypothetical protein
VLEENLELARRVIHLSELSRRLETIEEQVRVRVRVRIRVVRVTSSG